MYSRLHALTRFLLAAVLVTATLTPQAIAAQRGRGGGEEGSEEERQRDPLQVAVGALRFRSIGPAVVSGRISDIAVHPTNKSIWYIAAASGGLWKTTNAGTSFSPIFDGEGSYSIGEVVIDPNNPNVVWVGTGENNAQRSVSYGDGVYKSIDGGRSWTNMGLPQSEHIGRILIDPRNSDVVYVASQGPVFNGGGDRGLYKTTDGGSTWNKILDGGEWAGVSDVVRDPRNPDVLIASVWQRARRQFAYIAGGPESGLHRSTDGGETWTRSQRGLPSGDLGRIGLTISPVDPDIVYAIVEAASNGGFYRSQNNGVTWERMSDRVSIGLYYQEIEADPVKVDRVYSMDTYNWISDDGGRTFQRLGESNKHVDNQALWIDPDDNNHLILGCDGGLYQSFDRGATYDFFQNLPLGQFYRVEVDSTRPFYRVFGGTQDNSSFGGPSRTRTRQGGRNADWFLTQGGDGFYSRIDPVDPNIVYAESQYAGLTRFNLATGERVSIRPEGELGEALVWHWDAPLIISPHSPSRLYFAANRVFRSDDRGSSWRAVSPDLTKQIDRNRLKIMGRVWGVDAVAKNASTSIWGAVVSLAESPLQEGLLFAGTDDGMIQISEDGGENWRAIPSVDGVPDTTFISDIQPSWHDVSTVYIAFDNHKAGDYKPYIAKSTDLGRSWDLIQSNLPERGTVYTILEDYKDPDLLFAGTEFAIYFSNDGGEKWTRIRGGLPTIFVRDMTFQTQHDDLVIATFGRGFYVLDDLETLRALTPELLASEGGLLPVNRTPLFVASNPDPSWQGERFTAFSNPPLGVAIHYYLKDAIRSRRQERQRADRAAARRGEDVFYPSWDSLRAEDLEVAPQMILTISDQEGRTVRRLTGRTSAGVTRVIWDLRYPSTRPITGAEDGGFRGGGAGPYVVPGTYTVSLAKMVDGVATPVGEPQSFEVYPLDDVGTPRSAEIVAFQQETARLQRAVLGANAAMGEAMTRIGLLRRALNETPGADPQLSEDLRALETSIRELQWELSGDPTVGRRREATPTSLMQRLSRATSGWSGLIHEVTGLQREQYEIVAEQFGNILERLRPLIEVELKRIEHAAEEAGAPWTSGRVPTWRP
ncbi:MAG: glycosyl hydrolase [Gemmatimonadota bacterium]|nr:MAG: glycosyl hydrolase [Gemmatimonadota bacterium]